MRSWWKMATNKDNNSPQWPVDANQLSGARQANKWPARNNNKRIRLPLVGLPVIALIVVTFHQQLLSATFARVDCLPIHSNYNYNNGRQQPPQTNNNYFHGNNPALIKQQQQQMQPMQPIQPPQQTPKMVAINKSGKQIPLIPGLLDESLLQSGSFSFGSRLVKFNKLKVLGNVYVNRVNGRLLRDTYLFKGGPPSGLQPAHQKRSQPDTSQSSSTSKKQQVDELTLKLLA